MMAAINRLALALWCAMPSRWFRRGRAAKCPGGHPNSPTDGHLKLPHLN